MTKLRMLGDTGLDLRNDKDYAEEVKTRIIIKKRDEM